MNKSEVILKNVRVASPCPTNWENMDGDDRVRHCSLCRLNVYNLSEMTEKEAARLVSEREGRLCVRYYQRRDGTVLTRDCPVGIRAIRKRVAHVMACAIVLLISSLAYASSLGRRDSARSSASLLTNARDRAGQNGPVKTLLNWIDPVKPATFPTMGESIMGDVATPSPLLGAIAVPNPIQGRIATPQKTTPDGPRRPK